MVNHLDDYPWSSHHAYVGVENQSWVTTDCALVMFHTERERGVVTYRRFVDEDVAASVAIAALDCNNDNVSGADDFISKLHREP
jgi:putative transposase